MAAVFVGRRRELALLTAEFDDVVRDGPRLVLVVGEAGIGKTTLLREFLRTKRPDCVLWASGDELEVGLPFGVVHQLLAPLDPPLPVSFGALQTENPEPADPFRIGAGLVELLGHLQGRHPAVVLIVDDTHWADRESLRTIVFALRRLRADNVLTVLTTRAEGADQLPPNLHRLIDGGGGSRLNLGGLDVGDLRALDRALGGAGLTRHATRLHDHTGGNPLHATAVLGELATRADPDRTRPLPVPGSFRTLVLQRLAACSPEAQRLVVAVAVLGGRPSLSSAARLADITDPLGALETAITAALLEERSSAPDRAVTFTHPLARSAVYDSLGPAQRAAGHARAIALVDDEAAVRHRVAAAAGPDPDLALELAMLAQRQALAGKSVAAAETFFAAARLSADQSARRRFVLAAVENQLLGGAAGEAAGLAPELEAFPATARRDFVLARLATVLGRHAEADRLLTRAWGEVDAGTEPVLAAAIAEQLALSALLHVRGRETVMWARRAQAVAPAEPAAYPNLLDMQAMGLGLVGEADEALRITADRPDPTVAVTPGGLDGWIGRGLVRLWCDDLAGAQRDLSLAVSEYARRHLPPAWRLIGLTFLSETEFRSGAWDDAILHGELAVSIAQDTEQDWLRALVHAVAALPLAARGLSEPASAHVDAASGWLQQIRIESSAPWVAMARASLALAVDAPDAVAAALEPVSQVPVWAALPEPGVVPWAAARASALIDLGRLDDAERQVQALERSATIRRCRSALVAAARVRGRLAAAGKHPEQADAAFRLAFARAEGLAMPFERAVLDAQYGRFLLQQGRGSEARARLEAAKLGFGTLGARPFLDRCERDLDQGGRAGARPVDRSGRNLLTPQELAVSRLVADGRTNRQVAAELVVSVKTVEYHLGNVYQKLSISSRTQLALIMNH